MLNFITAISALLFSLPGLANAASPVVICIENAVLQLKPDSQNQKIIQDILDRKARFAARAQIENPGKPVDYFVFMDFDGTIIDGDVTEGLKSRYLGLAEVAIRAGLGPEEFAGSGGFKKFEAKYHEIHDRDGTGAAYTWVAEQFAHLPTEKRQALDRLVSKHWQNGLKDHLFSSSMEVIKAMHDNGIHVVIVSASPQIFVEGAASYVNVPKSLIFGIDRTRNSEGQLIDPVVNYGPGKIDRIEQILAASEKNSKIPAVLGGFGNSWGTDGPFLNWIANTRDGLSVMINGGKAPKPDHKLFEVQQVQTVHQK